MKTLAKKLMAFALCLAMVLGLFVTSVGATQSAPKADESADKVIYATDSTTTYVPAGYTYVYQSTDGRTYTRKASQDTYISGRTLTATEAKALASLSYGAESTITTDDGKTLVCREYDAAEAAAYSDAVKAILSGQDYDAGDKVTVVSDSHEKTDKVKVIILLDEPSVSEMDGMTVELGKGLGQAEQAAVRKVKDGQSSVISAAKRKLGSSMEVTGQFSLVTNAIAATVSYGDMETLSDLPGVKKVFLSPCYSVPEINAVETDASQITTNMKFAASGMGANAAWDAGFDGTGMSVAVIDTGLCFENPTFDKEPSDPDAVAYTKADIAAILESKTLHAEELDESTAIDTVYYSSKVPFGFNYADGEANFGSDDDTWMGHGSHVAGIIAGNLTKEDQEQFDMTYLGIAPEAQLIIMKVFDMNGDCYFDYLIAAIEDSIALGVDCANLSLGLASGPYYYEGVTEVYDAATAAGISVCVSAGNDGFTGTESLWGDEQVKASSVSTGTLGMPGTFDSVLTVASAENEGVKWLNDVGSLSWFNKTMDMQQLMSVSELDDVPEGKGFYENLRPSEEDLTGGTYDYTESIADSKGKIVFVPFEGGNGDSVIAEAKAAGAAGVVFYDPTPTEEEKWDYIDVELTSYDVPAARANLNEFAWMKQNNDTGAVSVMADWNRNNVAGEMSSFSSWGPTEGLSLKPDITGIGGNVFSAYYGEYFAVASGTSMSSPAVAASMALLRQYLKTTSIPEADYAKVANCLLMSTATPVVDEANGTYYFVRRQGAGLANVGNAVKSGAYITVEGTDKAKLELGEDKEKTGTYEMTFSVVNFSDVDKTYTLSLQGLGQAAEGGLVKGGKVTYLTQNYAKQLDATYTSNLTDNKLTVPAGTTAKVTVTLQLSDAQKAYYDERFENGAYVEGYIQLTGTDSVPLSVPFLAFYGDFGAAPAAETGSYATLMGGERAYNTADQVVSGIYSYRPTNSDPALSWMTEKAWLGGTASPGYGMVPMEDFKFSTMSQAYKGFLPQTAGISPNGDYSLDEFHLQIGLLRNVDNIHYTITNLTTGEILSEQDTEFMQKSYAADVYAGAEDLDMEWFYAKKLDENGEEVIDETKCGLPENTLISIKAEITPECKTAKTQTIEYTFYIDTTGPMSKKPTFGYKTEDWGWGPESMYNVTIESDEYWWNDYSMSISIDIDEETGETYASAFTSTYFPNNEPNGEGVHSTNEAGSMMFEGTHTEIALGYDYAGNCSAYTISGSMIEENISLSAETDSIYVGDELTIRNTDTEDYTALLDWEVSDPEIAEIVTSDSSSVTIKGLKRGDVVVTASIGEFKKSITIHVLDKDYENQKQISLTSDKDTIYVGDELTIKNAAADEYPTHMSWAVSDPAVAEIVTSDDTGVTIKGLKYGDVTVTGGTVDEFKKSITIHVRDKSYEDLANGFKDISGHWAEKTIVEAVSSGLFNGVSATEFDPDSAITRAMFVTVLYRMDGAPEVDQKAAFTDVADGSYYADAVAWAAKNGIVNGVSETSFDPDASITREQMAAILYRYAAYCKADVSTAADLGTFTDASAISDYAKTAMQWAVAAGVMNGTSATTIDPSATATRAQAATVLVRFQTGIKN